MNDKNLTIFNIILMTCMSMVIIFLMYYTLGDIGLILSTIILVGGVLTVFWLLGFSFRKMKFTQQSTADGSKK